jgi:signal transduction histidine kinase
VLKKYDFKSELVRAYLGRSNVELEFSNYAEAEKALMHADTIIRKSKNSESLPDYYYMYYLIYNKKKEYKKALDYHLLYTKANEDVQLKLNTKALEELQLKYNVQQKEIDLEKEKTKSVLLEKSHQKEVYLRWILLSVGFIAIILVAVLFYMRYYRAIRNQQAQFSRQLITNTEEERSRIAKDLHDDIGQSLSILKSKFTNKNQFENSDIISKEIERVIDQTRQISRNLFPSYLEKIGLKRAIAGLAEGVQNNNNIECSFEVADAAEKIPSEIATHVFRIIQECLNNTIKHSKASALKISLTFDENTFMLQYMDNGNWKKTSLKDPGVGLLSIKERAKIIKGILQIDENEIKGFKLTLKFNL